jgi:hypothetical protein
LTAAITIDEERSSAMNGPQFDKVSKVFAERRLSRRRALAQGGVGVAVGVLAATHRNAASGQDATPDASVAEPVTTTLFVQSFQSGTIAPKEGEAGTFTLTLEHGLGQTIYFSDRPERVVGASPTQDFLNGLGFPSDNPPNAALLVESAPGDTDIAVLELLNPRYEASSHTATYDVQILKEYERTLGISFAEQPTDLSQLHPSFGAAHLFIDGCPDAKVVCWDYVSSAPNKGQFTGLPFCYWEWYGCIPCAGDGVSYDQIVAYWNQKCNDTFSVCGGNCYGEWNLT